MGRRLLHGEAVKSITVTLPPRLLDALADEAVALGMSQSQVLAKILREHLVVAANSRPIPLPAVVKPASPEVAQSVRFEARRGETRLGLADRHGIEPDQVDEALEPKS